MSAMPEYPRDQEALLKVDRAHKALNGAMESMQSDLDKAVLDVEMRHNPFIFAAQSVFYEAMGNAALAGFTREELESVIDCGMH